VMARPVPMSLTKREKDETFLEIGARGSVGGALMGADRSSFSLGAMKMFEAGFGHHR